MSLVQAGDVLREYLYPKLEITLLYADISRKRLRKWAQLIRRAVLHHGHDLATRSIALPALFSALGVLPLEMHASLVRATEVGVMLRSAEAACATQRDPGYTLPWLRDVPILSIDVCLGNCSK